MSFVLLCLIYFCVPPNSKYCFLCIVTINIWWINSFHRYLLSAYYKAGIVVSTRDRARNKIDKILALLERQHAK